MNKQRTSKQNRALHLYFRLIADELKRRGISMYDFLEPKILEIPASEHSVKLCWKDMQAKYLGRESTTELTTKELTEVYDIFNNYIATNFGCHVPFPDQVQLLQNQDSLIN